MVTHTARHVLLHFGDGIGSFSFIKHKPNVRFNPPPQPRQVTQNPGDTWLTFLHKDYAPPFWHLYFELKRHENYMLNLNAVFDKAIYPQQALRTAVGHQADGCMEFHKSHLESRYLFSALRFLSCTQPAN